MKTSHFFLALAVLLTALVAYRFTFAPLGTDVAGTIARSVGQMLGAMLWGALIWGLVRLATGADNAPDIRRYGVGAVLILVPALLIAEQIEERYGSPTGQDRQEFTRQFTQGCFTSQRKMEGNEHLSDETIRNYCSCVGTALSEDLTKAELKNIRQAIDGQEGMPASFKKRVRDQASECRDQLSQG